MFNTDYNSLMLEGFSLQGGIIKCFKEMQMKGRKIMTTKQEMKEQAKKLQEELDKLNSQIEKMPDEVATERWRAKYDNTYYCIAGYGEIYNEKDYYNKTSQGYYNLGLYFKTKEEAKEYKENLLTKQKLKDLALKLNKGIKIEWGNLEQRKYLIYHDTYIKELVSQSVTLMQDIGQVYCLDTDFLKIAEKEIGEDKLIKLFKSGV